MMYGTLLPGRRNHQRYCFDAISIQPATVHGILYDLPYGYPAMFEVSDEIHAGSELPYGTCASSEAPLVHGILYDLPHGYPAMFDSGDASNIVHGELITFPDIESALKRLDRLEGYNPDSPDSSLYLRIVKPVTITATGKVVRAYLYVFHPRKLPEVKRIGTLIENGVWYICL